MDMKPHNVGAYPEVLLPDRACERFYKKLPKYNVVTGLLLTLFIVSMMIGLLN